MPKAMNILPTVVVGLALLLVGAEGARPLSSDQYSMKFSSGMLLTIAIASCRSAPIVRRLLAASSGRTKMMLPLKLGELLTIASNI